MPGSGGAGHRGRNNLKLLRRIDGQALLIGDTAQVAVTCAAGEFEERMRTTITGSLDGDLRMFSDGEEARLRFPDDAEVRVRLIEPDELGADFRSL